MSEKMHEAEALVIIDGLESCERWVQGKKVDRQDVENIADLDEYVREWHESNGHTDIYSLYRGLVFDAEGPELVDALLAGRGYEGTGIASRPIIKVADSWAQDVSYILNSVFTKTGNAVILYRKDVEADDGDYLFDVRMIHNWVSNDVLDGHEYVDRALRALPDHPKASRIESIWKGIHDGNDDRWPTYTIESENEVVLKYERCCRVENIKGVMFERGTDMAEIAARVRNFGWKTVVVGKGLYARFVHGKDTVEFRDGFYR